MIMFESCVVLDGNESGALCACRALLFESCVVLDGNESRTA